jgi:hypothetical protein
VIVDSRLSLIPELFLTASTVNIIMYMYIFGTIPKMLLVFSSIGYGG